MCTDYSIEQHPRILSYSMGNKSFVDKFYDDDVFVGPCHSYIIRAGCVDKVILSGAYGKRVRRSTTMMERYSCAVTFTQNHGPRGSRHTYKFTNAETIKNHKS